MSRTLFPFQLLIILSTSCFPESSDEGSLSSSPLRHTLPQSMKIVHEIMYKVEVLYVLCVLLMGRQRNQVEYLLELNLDSVQTNNADSVHE